MGDRRILMGVVGRPHGVRGLVRVHSYTADPADLAGYGPLLDDAGRAWTLAWRASGVAELRGADGQALDGRAAAERLGRDVNAPALPEEGEAMLSLAALVGLQSRGLPVAAERDSAVAAGEALFTTRMGQLNLSCADCHDGLAGGRLGGARIPQGRVNAYPEYRLEWQGMGGLLRRIRNCMTGVRAEPFPAASAEMASLRAYLGWRSNGLLVETPGVRP